MLVEGTSLSAPARGHSYRDDFREAGGFLVVIQLISTLDRHQSHPALQVDLALQIEIFRLALSILSSSLVQHPLNVKAFEATVGWKSLLAAISIALNGIIPADHVAGSLLGLAVADVSTYAGHIVSTRRYLADHVPRVAAGAAMEATPTPSARAQLLESRVRDQWTPVPTIVFPHAARILLQLLLNVPLSEEAGERSSWDSEGIQIVLHTLLRLLSTSRRNQVALAGISLSTLLLEAALLAGSNNAAKLTSTQTLAPISPDMDNMDREAPTHITSVASDPQHRSLLSMILNRLYSAAGIPDKDGRKLLVYLSSETSRIGAPQDEGRDRVLNLLLDIADTSQEPNTVLFSMAEYGHASLAFSTLRRPFPPSSSSTGFTFVTTFSIERIEPSLPIELLTLFDAQKFLHVQLSIEPGTGHFSYITSSLASSPPTRFNSTVFVTGKRYHLVFVHLQPRGGAHMSPARLYVDGELAEEKLAPWPVHNRGLAISNTPTAGHLANPVRAVLGTPPNSTGEARHVEDAQNRASTNRLVWSLGPTMLIDDAIPNDLPLVFYELGPRYTGNAQDSLGRFLTYRASANINLRLEQLARKPSATTSSSASVLSEKELANLPLVTAIAGRASELVPEERLYFVVNAANTATFDRTGAGANRQMSGAVAGSSSDPSKRSGSRVVLNQAVPLNREAIGSSFGLAKLYGEPALLVPRSLDEMIWKLGGSAILLKAIADADTPGLLAKTLRLFLLLISQSWRLSEDVERCKGYEVLGSLLHGKGPMFTDEIVTTLFNAVGIDVGDEQVRDGSLLVNPFLYRVVMLDFQLWSRTSRELQVRHLQHFTSLLRTSRHRRVSWLSPLHSACCCIYKS